MTNYFTAFVVSGGGAIIRLVAKIAGKCTPHVEWDPLLYKSQPLVLSGIPQGNLPAHIAPPVLKQIPPP